MTKHEPLSDEQLAFYKNILTERKRELLKQVLNQDEDLDEIRGDVAADPLDAAGNASSLELMTTLGNHERLELAEIDNALQKIENGSYGFCEESGNRFILCVSMRCPRRVIRCRFRNGSSAPPNSAVGPAAAF